MRSSSSRRDHAFAMTKERKLGLKLEYYERLAVPLLVGFQIDFEQNGKAKSRTLGPELGESRPVASWRSRFTFDRKATWRE